MVNLINKLNAKKNHLPSVVVVLLFWSVFGMTVREKSNDFCLDVQLYCPLSPFLRDSIEILRERHLINKIKRTFKYFPLYLSEFVNLWSFCEFLYQTGDLSGQLSTSFVCTGSLMSFDLSWPGMGRRGGKAIRNRSRGNATVIAHLLFFSESTRWWWSTRCVN